MSLIDLEQKIIDNAAQKTYQTQNFAADIDANFQLLANSALYYGVKWTKGQSNPALTRVGNYQMIQQLPVHNAIRPAVVNDDLTVNYYLKPKLTEKVNGEASDLTGADGQVGVVTPKMWLKFYEEGGEEYALFSPYPLKGFIEEPSHFIGIWPGYLDAENKLASVADVLPTSYRTPVQYLADARARGAGWYSFSHRIWNLIYRLYLVEYANFNFQATISQGVTNASSGDWSDYNGYNPFITNGIGKAVDIVTGEIPVTINSFANGGVDPLNTQVAVFRHLRLLHGCWEWVSGLAIDNDGVSSKAYIADNHEDFDYSSLTNYRFIGDAAENDNYISQQHTGTMIPSAVAGSSSTHRCDRYYTLFDSDPSNGRRAVRAFGRAYIGDGAGPACAFSNYSPGNSSAHAVSRLCGDMNE